MVVVSVVLLMVLLFSVGDFEGFLKPMTTVRVAFQDIRGLKVNDPVLYAGVDIGRVADIRIESSAQGQSAKVLLELKIDSDFQIRQDANVRIGKTFTGKTSVKIKPGNGPRLSKGQIIAGENVPELSDLTAISRPIVEKIDATLQKINEVLGEEERASIRKFITSLDHFSKTLNAVGDNMASLTEADGRLQGAVDSIRAAADKVRQMLDGQQGSLDALMKNLRDASGELKTVMGEGRKGLSVASQMFDQAAATLGKLNNMIDVNASDLQQAVANIRDTTAYARALLKDVKKHPWKLVRKSKSDEPARTLSIATEDLDRSLARLDASLEKLLTLTESPNTAVQQHLGEIRDMVIAVKELAAQIQETKGKLKK